MPKKHIKESASGSVQSESAFGIGGDLDQLDEKTVREELAKYQTLWTWLPDNIKYLLHQIGRDVVFTDRNNRYHYGFFHGFECDITQYKVFSANIRYDEINHKPYIEKGADILFSSMVTNFKFIDERVEEQPTPIEDNATKIF